MLISVSCSRTFHLSTPIQQQNQGFYTQNYTQFFVANDIVDVDKKRDVFLSVVGPATYKLLGDLLAPPKPGDKSYNELVKVVMNHCNPTPSEIVERFKFHT